MNRVRVVGWKVEPVVMLDDGDNLTPLQVSGGVIPAAEWDAWKAGGDQAAIDAIVAQVSPPADA